jgi:hypothetical protein
MLLRIGAPAEDLKDFRTIKLLEALVSLATEARNSGLRLREDGNSIWQRVKGKGKPDVNLVSCFFALHDLRILYGHKIERRDGKLWGQLKYFGMTSAQTGSAFGEVLDVIHDTIAKRLSSMATIFWDAR